LHTHSTLTQHPHVSQRHVSTLIDTYPPPTQRLPYIFSLFFFTPPAPPEIYTLSLHDALPISVRAHHVAALGQPAELPEDEPADGDRKSTRLNSSHLGISYAVFCLKKKKKKKNIE